jgi:hypothetical protein
VNHPDQIEGYVRWALHPDGPAYHEAPTPITCKWERSYQEYIVRVIPVLVFIKICSVSIISTRRAHFNHPSLSGLQSTSSFKQRAQFSIRRSVCQIHQRDSMGFCSFLYALPFVFGLLLTACHRSSVPLWLSVLDTTRNQRDSFLTRITGVSWKPTWSTLMLCDQNYGRKSCIGQTHRM